MGAQWAPVDIAWPALLACSDAETLTVVHNQDEWDVDPELHGRAYGPDDRLVDSEGREYTLMGDGTEPVFAEVVATGLVRTSADLYDAATRHLEAIGSPIEWLDAYLADIAEPQQLKAIILYVARHDASESEEEE